MWVRGRALARSCVAKQKAESETFGGGARRNKKAVRALIGALNWCIKILIDRSFAPLVGVERVERKREKRGRRICCNHEDEQQERLRPAEEGAALASGGQGRRRQGAHVARAAAVRAEGATPKEMAGAQHTHLSLSLSSHYQLGLNFSDRSGPISLDVERGAFKLGYDLQREVRGARERLQKKKSECVSPDCVRVCVQQCHSVVELRSSREAPNSSGACGVTPALAAAAAARRGFGRKRAAARRVTAADDDATRVATRCPLRRTSRAPKHSKQTTSPQKTKKQQDVVAQYKRKAKAGTFTVRQVVPALNWAVVPSPVVELSTQLVENARVKDSLRLVYDFQHRYAYYTETLKLDKKFKLRVAGDTKVEGCLFVFFFGVVVVLFRRSSSQTHTHTHILIITPKNKKQTKRAPTTRSASAGSPARAGPSPSSSRTRRRAALC